MRKSIIEKITFVLTVLLVFQIANAQEKPKAELIDSFSYSNSEVASARIDNWRIALNQSPNIGGYVIVYGGKIGKKGEVKAHIRGIKQAFALKRLDGKRVPIINGGFRNKVALEFWIIPKGSVLPEPTPTVEAKKVLIKGVSRKIIPYECCF